MALDFASQDDGSARVVTATGELTDEVDFGQLEAAFQPQVTLDLRGVSRMNADGVRSWVEFAQAVPADVQISLVSCPTFFFKQVTLVQNFLGRTKIKSVFLPMVCASCEAEATKLVQTKGLSIRAAGGKCEACGGELELDEADEVFQVFVDKTRL